jgi:hypothetical protein
MRERQGRLAAASASASANPTEISSFEQAKKQTSKSIDHELFRISEALRNGETMNTPEFKATIARENFRERLKGYDPGAFYVFDNNDGNVLAKMTPPQDANDKNPYAHRGGGGYLRTVGEAVGGAVGGFASDMVDGWTQFGHDTMSALREGAVGSASKAVGDAVGGASRTALSAARSAAAASSAAASSAAASSAAASSAAASSAAAVVGAARDAATGTVNRVSELSSAILRARRIKEKGIEDWTQQDFAFLHHFCSDEQYLKALKLEDQCQYKKQLDTYTMMQLAAQQQAQEASRREAIAAQSGGDIEGVD